ncbi:ATP-binding protein [Caryophanon tenue]|uniref:histidine kinase n=1 Tax=Caryophanon tenue TaxID=33978 RepID=A0A1C0YI19_9BACL|nr:sensor histidine kinase [Caryophanon tenue]OCS86791.1 histidine kinase [Caryophanon tenue]
MKQRLQHSLTARLLFTMSSVILIICVIFLVLIQNHITETVTAEKKAQALQSAHLIASRPDVIAGIASDDPTRVLQPLALAWQQQIDAAFVVIGNENGIRYTHPDSAKIGQSMVGGDNDAALINRQAFVSTTTGSMGESIRGKVPIIVDEQVIGIVSVGFLTKDIQQRIDDIFTSWLKTSVLVALFGVLAALLLALYVKRQLLGMQPTQIAKLYTAYHTILEETTDGIILTDDHEKIVLYNTQAKALLHKLQTGHLLTTVLPLQLVNERIIRALELPLNDKAIIVTKMPLQQQQQRLGFLYILRPKQQYEEVVNELQYVKQQARIQRAKTHEFANKLHVLLGLLKTNHVDEAVAFITDEQQRATQTTSSSMLLNALLEGKMAEAAERHIELTVEGDRDIMPLNDRQTEALLTALGNIVQNAIEALTPLKKQPKKIHVLMYQYAHELAIEIHDNGEGIPLEKLPSIFTLGYTTKQGYDRGYGLAISQQALHFADGELFVEESDLGGACFLIILKRI